MPPKHQPWGVLSPPHCLQRNPPARLNRRACPGPGAPASLGSAKADELLPIPPSLVSVCNKGSAKAVAEVLRPNWALDPNCALEGFIQESQPPLPLGSTGQAGSASGMVLDCAPGKGFTPGPGVSGTIEEPKGVDVVGPNQLRGAQAADAVGSKGGTERRRSLEKTLEAERLALRVLEGRTWTTKKV